MSFRLCQWWQISNCQSLDNDLIVLNTELPTLAILTTTGKHQFLVFLDLEEKLKESAGARTIMVKKFYKTFFFFVTDERLALVVGT